MHCKAVSVSQQWSILYSLLPVFASSPVHDEKLLLAEWHALDLDLDLTALDVLELQCDFLLDLAIRNGDDAVLGEHAVAVFTG